MSTGFSQIHDNPNKWNEKNGHNKNINDYNLDMYTFENFPLYEDDTKNEETL